MTTHALASSRPPNAVAPHSVLLDALSENLNATAAMLEALHPEVQIGGAAMEILDLIDHVTLCDEAITDYRRSIESHQL